MMRKLFLAGFLAVAVGSVALAQSEGQQQGGGSQQQAGQGGNSQQGNRNAPIAGTTTLGVQVNQLDWVAVGYRASKLLGSNVWNDKNQKVGKLGDLIIKPDGSVSIAIVDVGGFLGMGVHQVAIPVGQFTNVSPKIVLPGATKDALKALPEFKFANREGSGS